MGVTFSEAVTVTGTPQITLDIGGTEQAADYSGAGAATGQLLFSYTVQPVDQDDDGVAVKANSLALNGGTIQSSDDMANATLTHSAMTFANHKVDTELTLVSNMGQADGTPVRISATQAVRMEVVTNDNQILFNLNEFIVDVKTASPTLQLTVTLELVVDLNRKVTDTRRFTGSARAVGKQVLSYAGANGDTHVNLGITTQGERGYKFASASHYIYITGSGSGFVELERRQAPKRTPFTFTIGALVTAWVVPPMGAQATRPNRAGISPAFAWWAMPGRCLTSSQP